MQLVLRHRILQHCSRNREQCGTCYDGNNVAAGGCTNCINGGCCDGIIDNAGTEGCDDGNRLAADGCTS
eukprot:877535-Rhodomonas_salina.1